MKNIVVWMRMALMDEKSIPYGEKIPEENLNMQNLIPNYMLNMKKICWKICIICKICRIVCRIVRRIICAI
jgi:hypothetical protein